MTPHKRRWDSSDTLLTVILLFVLGWGVVVAHFIVKFW